MIRLGLSLLIFPLFNFFSGSVQAQAQDRLPMHLNHERIYTPSNDDLLRYCPELSHSRLKNSQTKPLQVALLMMSEMAKQQVESLPVEKTKCFKEVRRIQTFARRRFKTAAERNQLLETSRTPASLQAAGLDKISEDYRRLARRANAEASRLYDKLQGDADLNVHGCVSICSKEYQSYKRKTSKLHPRKRRELMTASLESKQFCESLQGAPTLGWLPQINRPENPYYALIRERDIYNRCADLANEKLDKLSRRY